MPVPVLQLHTSNRVEELTATLCGLLGERGTDPLVPEIVLVQERGLGRWLAREIAHRLGVFCNVRFPFPQTFLEDLLLGNPAGAAETMLTWQLHDVLSALPGAEETAALRRYLSDEDDLKRFQLARQIARAFSRYPIECPESVRRWARPGGRQARGDDWQPVLWRALGDAAGGLETLADAPARVAALASEAVPRRLYLFGITVLPPLVIDVLARLARRSDVHLFLLVPSDRYLGDLVSPRTRARRAIRDQAGEPGEEPAEIDQPLVASWGRQVIRFSSLLEEFDLHPASERFVEPQGVSLLVRLQQEMLALSTPETRGAAGAGPIDPEDRSMQFHSCHSPLREVEVLHDRLLDLFEQLPGLDPHDILVMMPDVDRYAPLIDAVFGAPEEGSAPRIPHSVVDRRAPRADRWMDALLGLLTLPLGRCTNLDVLRVIESEPVRRRFGFSEEDLARLREWVRRSGIRWGIDATHRATLSLPPTHENTWEFGFDRLLAGCVVPEDAPGTSECGGVVPVPVAWSDDAELLGRFAACARALLHCARDGGGRRSPRDWCARAAALADGFFPDPDRLSESGRAQLRDVRETLRDAARAVRGSRATAPVDARTFAAFLEGFSAESGRGGGAFPGRGVVFGGLRAMRSVPRRVICMLGMDHDAFPRRDAFARFDLRAREGCLGARRVREDDRQLFLDSILCARDVFYLSYVGRSAETNRQLPPSVVVSELLEWIAPGNTSVLVAEHPLQAFSPRCFDGVDPRLSSYSRAQAEAASRLCRDAQTGLPAACDPGAAPCLGMADTEPVELERLASFLEHPARFLCRDILGIRPAREEEALEADEPFEVGGLDGHRLGTDLVAGMLEGREESLLLTNALGRGILPPGRAGRVVLGPVLAEAREITERVRQARAGCEARTVRVECALGDATVRGVLVVHGRAQVTFRFSKLDGHVAWRLRTWVAHLLGCASGESIETMAELRDGEERLAHIAPTQAREILSALVAFYRTGCTRRVPFFPETSSAWADAMRRGAAPDAARAIEEARKAWRGQRWGPGGDMRGERDDPFNTIVWRGEEPFGSEFEEAARMVWDPWLTASREEEKGRQQQQ